MIPCPQHRYLWDRNSRRFRPQRREYGDIFKLVLLSEIELFFSFFSCLIFLQSSIRQLHNRLTIPLLPRKDFGYLSLKSLILWRHPNQLTLQILSMTQAMFSFQLALWHLFVLWSWPECTTLHKWPSNCALSCNLAFSQRVTLGACGVCEDLALACWSPKP